MNARQNISKIFQVYNVLIAITAAKPAQILHNAQVAMQLNFVFTALQLYTAVACNVSLTRIWTNKFVRDAKLVV